MSSPPPKDPITPLAAALRRAITGEVRFDDGSRALYATDASNYRQVPIGVVLPRTIADVEATVALCREHGAPVLARGAGTSLAGQACNVAVVLDFTKYLHHVLVLDPGRRLARVEPGTVLDDLRDAAEAFGLTFGPDPATHNRCTLGGMLGNNSCGVHSVMAGRTSDNVHSLDLLTYDGLRLTVGATSHDELAAIIAAGGRRGEIYAGLRDLRDRYADLVRARFPDIPRRVSGYNLDALLPEQGFHVARALVGSEGTCATVLEATLHLVPSPRHRTLLLLGFRDNFVAADAVPAVLNGPHRPMGLEGLDVGVLDAALERGMRLPGRALFPPGGAWLIAEYGGDSPAEAEALAREAEAALAPVAGATRLLLSAAEQRQMWEVRESALGATAMEADGSRFWSGWEDAAVAPEKLGAYLRDFHQLMDSYDYRGHVFGHFGDGCVHVHLNFDFRSPLGRTRFRNFLDEAADLCVAHGGSLSGEHGDGQAHGLLLERMFGPELVDAFREFKAIWDPEGRMNPGKLVDARPPEADLRLGAAFDPPPVATTLYFAEDEGDFRRSVTRCVGVGKCRRSDGGTMCPSYMATREEAHSTRGRARLLFEMLQADPLEGGWRDEAVKDALDLCLACKACKTECPVNVDMASYKAEFLEHFYRDRRRPRVAYTLGRIDRWARLAGRTPLFAHLANAATQTPGLAAVSKWVAGVHPTRSLPRFDPHPFTRRRRPPAPDHAGQPRVILWPDTVNNHLHPEVAEAGARVLSAAGFQVELPPMPLCCGRPFYDFGLLQPAQQALEEILSALAEPIAAGVPVVGLEPSCIAVFRDELQRLFPARLDAQRLGRQSFLLGDFLARHAPDFRPPDHGGRRALLHTHCHQKALFGAESDVALLRAAGLQVETPDTGCCGLAGSFGFTREHYDLSMTVGERVLLPAVRNADAGTLVITSGFSCREQIAHGTGRRAWHVAEVLDRQAAS